MSGSSGAWARPNRGPKKVSVPATDVMAEAAAGAWNCPPPEPEIRCKSGLSRGQRMSKLASFHGLQGSREDGTLKSLYRLKRAIPGHRVGDLVSGDAIDDVLRHQEMGGKL